MKSKTLALFLFCGAVLCAFAQDAIKPAADGYITAIPSKANFDVDGLHIQTTQSTEYIQRVVTKDSQSDTTDATLANHLQVGQQVQIFGKKDSSGIVHAAQVILLNNPTNSVHGFGVIQAVYADSNGSVFEADGYRIETEPTAKISYGAHVQKSAGAAPGQWLAYSGKWDSHGHIEATEIKISEFSLSSRDKRMRKAGKNATLPPSAEDSKLQVKVSAIGNKLVPKFQKNLPADDPQKINFQFIVADKDLLYVPLALQDGKIIVPKSVVGLLQNDDQIAAVLANGIAQVLEWQFPHYDGVQLSGKGMAQALAVGFFAPMPVVLFAPIPYDAMIDWSAPLSDSGKEKARVALSLLQDAGYDITQAPVAWQRIGEQYPEKRKLNGMPQQSVYLIRMIAREYTFPTGYTSAQ